MEDATGKQQWADSQELENKITVSLEANLVPNTFDVLRKCELNEQMNDLIYYPTNAHFSKATSLESIHRD